MQGFWIALLLTTVAMAHADGPSSAADMSAGRDPSSLLLTPARCVALHQGQVCYQRVQVSWSSYLQGNYCLYQAGKTQPLQCWQEQTQGALMFEFASDATGVLQLKNGQQQVVAEATMEVAWVYKANTRRKTHWRLF